MEMLAHARHFRGSVWWDRKRRVQWEALIIMESVPVTGIFVVDQKVWTSRLQHPVRQDKNNEPIGLCTLFTVEQHPTIISHQLQSIRPLCCRLRLHRSANQHIALQHKFYVPPLARCSCYSAAVIAAAVLLPGCRLESVVRQAHRSGVGRAAKNTGLAKVPWTMPLCGPQLDWTESRWPVGAVLGGAVAAVAHLPVTGYSYRNCRREAN